MATTLVDIAEEVGVSVSTVSRVLNGKAAEYRISEETINSVHDAAVRLNYRPNHVARGLRLKKTNTLGLITPDVSNPFFAHIVKRVQQAAHEQGYSVFVCNTNENPSLENEHMALLFRHRVDGLIAMPVGQEYAQFAEWTSRGRPLVMLDRHLENVAASSVLVDNYTGACEAVEHLIEHGHRRIAIIQGLPGTYTTVKRVNAYRDTLAKHGIEVDDDLIVGGDFRRDSGYMATKLVLSQSDPPTAIFSTSDLITLGVLEALEEENRDIPEDISLVTFDDFDFAPYLRCPLTAVAQPRDLMGDIAVKLLVEQLEHDGDEEPKHIVLKPHLIIRDSVANLTAKVDESDRDDALK